MESGELHRILMESLENFQKSVTFAIDAMMKDIKTLQTNETLTSETLDSVIAPARGLFLSKLLSGFLKLALESKNTDAEKEVMASLWQLSSQLYQESLVSTSSAITPPVQASVEETIAQFHKTLAQKEQLIAQKIKENQDKIAAIQNKINAT